MTVLDQRLVHEIAFWSAHFWTSAEGFLMYSEGSFVRPKFSLEFWTAGIVSTDLAKCEMWPKVRGQRNFILGALSFISISKKTFDSRTTAIITSHTVVHTIQIQKNSLQGFGAMVVPNLRSAQGSFVKGTKALDRHAQKTPFHVIFSPFCPLIYCCCRGQCDTLPSGFL